MKLVSEVLDCLGPVGQKWPKVLEPTCGSGNFIRGLIDSPSPPREIRGFELQDRHLGRARRIAGSSKKTSVLIRKANIFSLDLKRDIRWHERGPLLVVGNPPWVTNAGLGTLESTNLPPKSNLKGFRGLDALTGSSNFDIAEYIWLKLIRELADQRPAIALLAKTSVARNVLQFARDNSLPISKAWLRRIDAKKYFNAAADACLFYVEINPGEARYEAAVFKDLLSTEPETTLSFIKGRLIADVRSYQKSAFVDGSCPLVWRQGVKHDAAEVMELRRDGTAFRNKLGEMVDVEEDHVYPLLKSRDLLRAGGVDLRLHVIIPQRRIGEETQKLRRSAPRLWDYLTGHANAFERRKSSIYRRQPPFAIFGIGDYCFAPYKVTISGFYKTPRFRLVGPVNNRPVMLDDTCYFTACSSAEQAALIAVLLNSQPSLDFIRSAMFSDSKRPITKKLLQRIDLKALLRYADRKELLAAADAELGRLLGEDSRSTHSWPSDLSLILEDINHR